MDLASPARKARVLTFQRRTAFKRGLCSARYGEMKFGKFGVALDGIQKNLDRAATKIDEARKGTRAIQRKPTDVQELPPLQAGPPGGVALDALRDEERVLHGRDRPKCRTDIRN